MGSFCVHCAVSGLPIDYNNHCVGWAVIPTPYGLEETTNDRFHWRPTCVPIAGKYDTYGGIESDAPDDPVLRGQVVLCHEDMFEEAAKNWDWFDHYGRSNEMPLLEAFQTAHTKFQEEHASYLKIVESGSDKDGFWQKKANDQYEAAHSAIYFRLRDECGYARILMDLCLGIHGSAGKIEKMEDRLATPRSEQIGPFERSILDFVINGVSTDAERARVELLQKLAAVYATTWMRGRDLVPNNTTWAEQCPDYKKDVKWTRIVAAKARKLRHDRVQVELKGAAEDRAWKAKQTAVKK